MSRSPPRAHDQSQHPNGPYDVSWQECLAMRLLFDDGWALAELALVFERDRRAVARHVHQECDAHAGEEPEVR